MVVPFTMPITRTICSPASDSRKRSDDGDGAGHGRLVEQVDPAEAATSASSAPATASSALFAVTTGLPLRRAVSTRSPGRMQPADDLDDDVDVVAGHQCGGVGADETGRDGHGPGPVRVGHSDADELEADARTGGDVLGTGEQDLGQRAPDIAAAEQATRTVGPGGRGAGGAGLVGGHLQRYRCAPATCPPPAGDGGSARTPGGPQASRLVRSSRVSRRTTTRAAPSATKTTAGRGTLL